MIKLSLLNFTKYLATSTEIKDKLNTNQRGHRSKEFKHNKGQSSKDISKQTSSQLLWKSKDNTDEWKSQSSNKILLGL